VFVITMEPACSILKSVSLSWSMSYAAILAGGDEPAPSCGAG
jgi:hypothetical protein